MNEEQRLTTISAEVADWTREKKSFFTWDPSRSLLASIRSYQLYADSKNILHVFLKRYAVLRHRFWSVITCSDIPLNCNIAGGLILPHPNGVIIHSDVTIGPNCIIFQQVTIGIANSGETPPIIGGHVDIGAGAIILGPITIGDHVLIGAHAIITKDIPAGKTARNTSHLEIY